MALIKSSQISICILFQLCYLQNHFGSNLNFIPMFLFQKVEIVLVVTNPPNLFNLIFSPFSIPFIQRPCLPWVPALRIWGQMWLYWQAGYSFRGGFVRGVSVSSHYYCYPLCYSTRETEFLVLNIFWLLSNGAKGVKYIATDRNLKNLIKNKF